MTQHPSVKMTIPRHFIAKITLLLFVALITSSYAKPSTPSEIDSPPSVTRVKRTLNHFFDGMFSVFNSGHQPDPIPEPSARRINLINNVFRPKPQLPQLPNCHNCHCLSNNVFHFKVFPPCHEPARFQIR